MKVSVRIYAAKNSQFYKIQQRFHHNFCHMFFRF